MTCMVVTEQGALELVDCCGEPYVQLQLDFSSPVAMSYGEEDKDGPKGSDVTK
jgi:hypothetical protein